MAFGLINAAHYPLTGSTRDLRIDFLRGLIMMYLIIVHFEYYSLYSLFAWERLALVSSAEGFVFLSGIVLGMVYRRRIAQSGFKTVTTALLSRAFKLYRVNLFMIASIALLGLLPFINTFEVTHWTNPWSKQSYPLFPAENVGMMEWVWKTLLLKIGPHQFQIMGLYVVLLFIAPAALYLMSRKQVIPLLLLSWILYLGNSYWHLRITGARFELAFPTLTWQLLFFNGMAIGYYRHKILDLIIERKNRWLFYLSLLVAFGFFLLTNNNSGTLFWPWGHFGWISPETYNQWYQLWFQKTPLGLGRLLNNAVLFICAYYLLSHYWLYINKSLGWLVIPLGQNSLYVFTLHVYFILVFENTGLPQLENFFINTLLHTSAILLIWAMVKKQILFNIIPR